MQAILIALASYSFGIFVKLSLKTGVQPVWGVSVTEAVHESHTQSRFFELRLSEPLYYPNT